MPAASPPATASILASLRREMKRQGIRVGQLAMRLGIAEPTMWRWLRGQGLTLDHLDRICQCLGHDLRDLIVSQEADRAEIFTLAQERILAADRGLGLLFFAILNGAQRVSLEQEFGLVPARVNQYLDRLRRMALIDVSPSGRLRPLVSRAVKWRPGGPLAIAFERTIKGFFLAMDFGAADARYVSDMVCVSEAARARIHALFESLRDDIHTIAGQDRAAPEDQRSWTGILMLIRQLDIREVTRGLH